MSNFVFDSPEDCINKYFDKNGTSVNVFEAGLYVGNTAERIIEEFHRKSIKVENFWAADSFEGLCSEAKGVRRSIDWAPGNFNAMEAFGVDNIPDAIQIIQEKIKKIYPPGLQIITGWFQDTFNNKTIWEYNIGDINLLHVDVDLFISSRITLDFVFQNGLLADGCVIRFDDFLSKDLGWAQGGESLSWVLAENKYQIRNDRISYNCFRVYK